MTHYFNFQQKEAKKPAQSQFGLLYVAKVQRLFPFCRHLYNDIMGYMHRESSLSDNTLIVDLGGQTLAIIT